MKGRGTKDSIFLNDLGLIKVKQLVMGCGMNPAKRVNTEEMVGKIVTAILAKNKYKDEATGETVDGSKIMRYLWPGMHIQQTS
jgi:hypothetical protein